MTANKTGTQERLVSIDAARGFAMFMIIGGLELLLGFSHITNNQGFIDLMTVQMRHAPWHGLTFADLLFPLFLLISGMTFRISYKKYIGNGIPRAKIYGMICKRALIMVALGLVYNGFLKSTDVSDLRIFSVLARLGVVWAVAAIISMHIERDWQWILWFVAPLLLYWLIMSLSVAPDVVGSSRFSMEGNIAGYIDRTLFPGHIYKQYYDPEGLLGYIPSVSTALLGMMTGKFLIDDNRKLSRKKKAFYIFAAGVVLTCIGLIWDRVFPINKRMWTSSFVCAAGGIGLMMYDVFYLVADVFGKKTWVMPFTVFGMNSIAAYLGYHLIDFSRTIKYLFGWTYEVVPENWIMMLDYFFPIAILWIVFYYLWKKNVYIKI